MASKCHNHKFLTDPLHIKEGTQNADCYNIVKVNQPALFLFKVISGLETN